MDINERLERYEQEIRELQEKVEFLTYTVDWLRYCKAPNTERFFYWNWIVEMKISERQEFLLGLIMTPFMNRHEEKPVQPFTKNKVSKIPVEGIDFDHLCRDEPIHYPEFAEAISKVMEWTGDTHVRAMLKAIYRNNDQRQAFSKYMLDEINEDPFSELYPERQD